jgi:UPF0042 nucleotide-binding protein
MSADEAYRVVLVLGMSGAGKSTVLRTLEDLQFETVDNVPLRLIPSVCQPSSDTKHLRMAKSGLAISAGARTRDFTADHFEEVVAILRAMPEVELELIFLDCADDVLVKRYSETRRRHPMAQDRPVEDGIVRERQLLREMRSMAQRVIDTTELDSSELRQVIRHQFGEQAKQVLSLCVTSFSYAKGVPRDADLVFDVRFLRNPHYDDALRPFTGRDEAVQAYISKDDAYHPFLEHLKALLLPLLPRYVAEGKSYLTMAVGCTGGKHRSVCIAEKLHQWLEEEAGYPSLLRHRDAPL